LLLGGNDIGTRGFSLLILTLASTLPRSRGGDFDLKFGDIDVICPLTLTAKEEERVRGSNDGLYLEHYQMSPQHIIIDT
jgi:hypothetical protein